MATKKEPVYKVKFCDTERKRRLAMNCINYFISDEPESGTCGFQYKGEGTIFVRRMESGNVIAHWQDD